MNSRQTEAERQPDVDLHILVGTRQINVVDLEHPPPSSPPPLPLPPMRTAASNISVQAPHGKQRDTIGILRRGLPPDTSVKSAYHGSRRRLLLDYAFPFFFNFLLRACHNIVEGDVIDPRILLQISLGRPLSPGRFAEGSGWARWDCYCRPLDQSVSWAFLTGTHSESLCRGVTVRCFVARPAHSVAARHPSIPKPPMSNIGVP